MEYVISADEVEELISPPPFSIDGYPRWRILIQAGKAFQVDRWRDSIRTQLGKSKRTIKADKLSLMTGICKSGGGSEPHSHEEKEQAFYILEGTGIFRVQDDEFTVKPGMGVYIPRNTLHSYRNEGKTDLVMVHIEAYE